MRLRAFARPRCGVWSFKTQLLSAPLLGLSTQLLLAWSLSRPGLPARNPKECFGDSWSAQPRRRQSRIIPGEGGDVRSTAALLRFLGVGLGVFGFRRLQLRFPYGGFRWFLAIGRVDSQMPPFSTKPRNPEPDFGLRRNHTTKPCLQSSAHAIPELKVSPDLPTLTPPKPMIQTPNSFIGFPKP